MKKWLVLFTVSFCLTLWGCSKEPAHQHTFDDWTLKETASCTKEGIEERNCNECKVTQTRPVAKIPHDLNTQNMCKDCKYVAFDPEATFVELGAFSNNWYESGTRANDVLDVKIWGNMVYRGVGDYDKNAGTAPIIAFNKETQSWVVMGNTADQAVHRFVEIDGTLYTPGVDADETWDLGNYYVLDGEKWTKVRNLPNGLHNFDMIGFNGEIFAGLGTENLANTVAVSKDKGKTFSFVPLYRDGTLLDTSGYEGSRTQAFVEYKGNLYAMVLFKEIGANSYDYFVFRYTDGKMEYQSTADARLTGRPGMNYWQGKLEWKGTCYLTSTALNAVTDFSKPETHKQIPMPNRGVVTDILLYNDELYVLSYTFKEDLTCAVVVYKSATGEEDSFVEVTSFDYAGTPISFDFDGDHFYIGIGFTTTDSSKRGMMLRVKPAA